MPSGPIKASGFRGLKIHFSIHRNIKGHHFLLKESDLNLKFSFLGGDGVETISLSSYWP